MKIWEIVSCKGTRPDNIGTIGQAKYDEELWRDLVNINVSFWWDWDYRNCTKMSMKQIFYILKTSFCHWSCWKEVPWQTLKIRQLTPSETLAEKVFKSNTFNSLLKSFTAIVDMLNIAPKAWNLIKYNYCKRISEKNLN